jgi:hypothetical protein
MEIERERCDLCFNFMFCVKVVFCNCNSRVFKNSHVRAFLLYNHWSFDYNGSLVDFLETAGQFIRNKWQKVFELHCSIVATGAGQIQRFQICFRQRRLVWGYVPVVHSFQHGVFRCLQNITGPSAECQLIFTGLCIFPESLVDIYLLLCAVWIRFWVTRNRSCVAQTVGPRLLWTRKVYYRVHKIAPVVVNRAFWMEFTRLQCCTLWSTLTF